MMAQQNRVTPSPQTLDFGLWTWTWIVTILSSILSSSLSSSLYCYQQRAGDAVSESVSEIFKQISEVRTQTSHQGVATIRNIFITIL